MFVTLNTVDVFLFVHNLLCAWKQQDLFCNFYLLDYLQMKIKARNTNQLPRLSEY